MLQGLLQAFSIPEVRKRILFTLGVIVVYRLGVWIPVPGVDSEQLAAALRQLVDLSGGIFQFMNMFNGGAIENASLFALGVIPYINASIIMSLLTSVIPKLKELQKEGDEGRKVINRYTRYGTVGLAIVQAFGMSYVTASQGLVDANLNMVWYYLVATVSLTTGTMFLMWVGERITENGIGRGISMIIMFGIVASYPNFIGSTALLVSGGTVSPLWIIIFGVVFIAVTAGIIMIQLGARKVDVQYAKRVVRGKVYGGQNTHIPLSVNQGGVIPIIFASALLTLPTTLLQMIPGLQWLQSYMGFGTPLYLVAYATLIIFFTFFYSHIVFDPRDLSDNLKKWGGYIPGIRPGQPTTKYIERVVDRLIFIGALFLTGIALLPYIATSISGITTFQLGGTSLLIVVGVGVDLIKQIEAHMVERHYESLIQKGAVLGRRS